jgi:hypothetical protein
VNCWNHSCFFGGREYSGVSCQPTGTTSHQLCGGDRVPVLKAARSTTGASYLPPDSPIWNCSRRNYGEARGAESRADFIHKLKVVFKELNETTIWLEVITASSLFSAENIVAIVAENRELCYLTELNNWEKFFIAQPERQVK